MLPRPAGEAVGGPTLRCAGPCSLSLRSARVPRRGLSPSPAARGPHLTIPRGVPPRPAGEAVAGPPPDDGHAAPPQLCRSQLASRHRSAGESELSRRDRALDPLAGRDRRRLPEHGVADDRSRAQAAGPAGDDAGSDAGARLDLDPLPEQDGTDDPRGGIDPGAAGDADAPASVLAALE